MAGVWRQHQLWDGTYTLEDLLDVHEALDLQEENQKRRDNAEELKRRAETLANGH